MTHYCPTCHRPLPSDPAEAHSCQPAPIPQDRVPGIPSPRAAMLRRAAVESLSEGLCHAAAFVAMLGILWGWIGFGAPLP